MKSPMFFLRTIVGAMAAAFVFFACAPITDMGVLSEPAGSNRTVSAPNDMIVAPLKAGKTLDAGVLTITREENTLVFTYKTNSSYLIAETHLWVGTALTAVPKNKQGIVIPGQFPYRSAYLPLVAEAQVRVPITWVDHTPLVVVAHASLVGANATISSETAFAGNLVYDSKRWTYYTAFNLPAVAKNDRSISGLAFFDANGNGLADADEPGIPDVTVVATFEGNALSAVTGPDGRYDFENLSPGLYEVSAGDISGLIHSSSPSVSVSSLPNPRNVNFGYALDLDWITGQNAGGFTIGYWKNNLNKALDGSTRGVQVPAETLISYVNKLSDFALSSLNPTSLSQAMAFMDSNSPVPADLLAKQLMASEFNYVNGAFFGGQSIPTYYFVFQGEYILKNSGSYSPEVILYWKDLFDAYNNTHGGTMGDFFSLP